MAMWAAVVWALAGAGVAWTQVGIQWTYTCAPGRFRLTYNKKDKNSWHYCYDGKYYSEKTLPADLRAYFEKVDRDMKESMDKFHKDWDESKKRSAEYWAGVDTERVAKGLPTMAEQRAENMRWAAERHGRKVGRLPAEPSGGSRTLRPPAVRGSGGIEASNKPEAEPVTAEALKAVAIGTTAGDLVAALGEPPGKVATGEGAETWTYVLTTGAFAKVRIEAGGVKEVVLP